jgi:hypothetical protein
MKKGNILQKSLPHVLVFLVFLLITFVYFSPVFEGRTLAKNDVIQSQGAAAEVLDYHEKTGKFPLWTNSMFGGMPAYLVGTDFPNSWSTKLGRVFIDLFPAPVNYVMLYLVGFYILLTALNFSPWLAALGAIGFAFGSYNLINIEAGHVSKALAMGYLPPIIAGVILAFRGRYWVGGALTGLFLALQLYGNHIQITYYLFITLAIYGIIELVYAIRENRLKMYMTAAAVLVLAVGLAFGSHASRLMVTNEYARESIRGTSDLTRPGGGGSTSGLDRDYAFMWSYGKLETLTLLIPNFYGGATGGSLGPSSETFAAIERQAGRDQARQFTAQVPLYWGSQPFTGGPAYGGAIICFLFVLGMFLVKDRIKWWILASAILLTSFAWGKNFFLNDLLFNLLPFFNKFRAVTMTLTLVQVFLALGAALAVREVVTGSYIWAILKKPLVWSLGLTAGVALLFALIGGALFDFSADSDTQQGLPGWLLEALRNDRKSLLRADALRSVFFILAAAGLLLAYVYKRMNATVLALSLSLLVLIDLFSVDKRYLNNDDFVAKRQAGKLTPTAANQAIQRDTTYYRVLNLTVNPIQDATTSYFHLSVGGYHAAKLQRYQQLYDSVISSELQRLVTGLQSESFSPAVFGQLPALNMLNTKYFILGSEAQAAVPNPYALGNAWFVREHQIVPNANAEIKAVKNFDPARTAIVDARYESLLTDLKGAPDSAAIIRLASYDPEHLTYQATTATPQLAVFSEVYYQGNNDWQAYVDGQPVPHLRANYLLRAMVVPAGTHKVEFIYTGHTYKLGETIALISSALLLVFVAGSVFLSVRRKEEPVKQVH